LPSPPPARQQAQSPGGAAIEQTLRLTKGTDSGYLPGWCRPVPEE